MLQLSPWGNLAQRCGRSTRVNNLVAAGLHLAALDATGWWWHRCWLSDMKRSGVNAGVISASCAPPRSARQLHEAQKSTFDGQPSRDKPTSAGLGLIAALTCHLIPICSCSPVPLKQALAHTQMDYWHFSTILALKFICSANALFYWNKDEKRKKVKSLMDFGGN